MKTKWVYFFLGIISTILVISVMILFTSYERNIDRMSGTEIRYKNVSVSSHLSVGVRDYLTSGNRKLYFGELPDQKDAIEINSPLRATLYVYPLDDESMIIRYEPRHGISRNYVKSGYGDFNRLLEVLYESTGNEVFNNVVDY